MNQERFYIPGDTQGQAVFPQYDIEDTFNSDNPIDFQVGSSTLRAVHRAGLRYGISLTDEEVITNSIKSIKWVVDSAKEGLSNLVVMSPNSEIALKLGSRIIDAPSTKIVSPSWVERQIDRYKRKQKNDFRKFYSHRAGSRVFFDIEEVTGVESFQLIAAQGALLYCNFITNAHKGNVVATMNREYNELAFLPDAIVQGPYDQHEQLSIVSSMGRPVEAVALDNFI